MLTATMRSPSPAALAMWLTLGATACSSPAPAPVLPLRAPDVEVVAEHFAGTSLSGARAVPALAGPDHHADSVTDQPGSQPPVSSAPWFLDCELVYLEDLPLLGERPLAARADLVADLRGSAPLLPSASLGADAEVLTGAPAAEFLSALRAGDRGRWLALAGGPSALPAGSTYALDAVGREGVSDPVDFLGEFPDRGPIPRRVGLRLTNPVEGGALRVGLVLQDLDPDLETQRRQKLAEAGPSAPLPPMAPEDESVRMELLRVAEPYDPLDGPLVLLVPSPFRGGNGRAFALIVEPRAGDPTERALARASASTQRASEAAELDAPSSTEAMAIELEAALTAMESGSPRSALLLLTSRTGAPLAADLALTLTRSDLQALSGSLFDSRTPAQIARDPAAVPLALERAAYGLLIRRALEGSIEPEQSALLHLHTGALGPYPDALEEILRKAVSLSDLERRIIEENLVFLEDSAAASRLRAHDWLRARGRDVADFDPLADRAARRAALEAARAASAQEQPAPQS